MNLQSFRFAGLAITLVVACVGSGFSQGTKAAVQVVRQPVVREFNPAFKGKPEHEIESLEHQLADAMRLKDELKFETLFADTILVAGLIANKKQLIALLKAADTKYYSIEKSEMRIQMYGDSAVATGIQKADIDLENGSRFSQTIFMNSWKRIDGKWQCIALLN